MEKNFFSYVSSKASVDPAPTVYLCAPEREAESLESLENFAKTSGWTQAAEEMGAVLVAPIAKKGWKEEPLSLLLDLYQATGKTFRSPTGEGIWGRSGALWCWETLLYVIGYQEGAVFAGNFLAAYPNFAAATALIGGLPDDFSPGENPSNHWLVRRVSKDYNLKNRQIPVCLWLFDVDKKKAEEAIGYFGHGSGGEVRLLTQTFKSERERSLFIMREEFSHRVRWKSGPDGLLSSRRSRQEFYEDPAFIRHTVQVEDCSYNFFVHLPSGKRTENLPVVFTLHGRGEPAWLFTSKNGWDTLSDETGEFILVSPDSPGNIWFLSRDGSLFEEIIRELSQLYGIDRERVYLTGFSNGAMMTREMAWFRPDLFAGIAPMNGPWFDTFSMEKADSSSNPSALSAEIEVLISKFLDEGWQMPCAFFYGDNDPAADPGENFALSPLLTAWGCSDTPSRILEGDRFKTEVYQDRAGIPGVSVTVMKNMPHGATREESCFAWEFLKHFRRQDGEKEVQYF